MTSAGGFISVCDGIGAVSEAWRDLPLGPVLLSEIAAFPRSVLEHRHGATPWEVWRTKAMPNGVPLWGDFTTIRDSLPELAAFGVGIESAEILVGGTPCQGFSFAGKRGGLSDDRSNLCLEFVRLADAIDDFRRARGLGPCVALWENVEGVLSMDDNAFGCFLAGLAGCGSALIPPGGAGWSDAGLVVGPKRAAAWRLFDAQYFGLAQRRRRVLVVASAAKGCPAEILFEREGVRRDSPPRRRSREDLAGTLAGGARRRGGYSMDDVPAACGGLQASAGGADENDAEQGRLVAFGGNRTDGPLDIAACLSAHGGGSGRMDFETETFVAELEPSLYRVTGNDGAYDTGEAAGALGTGTDPSSHVIAFSCKDDGRDATDNLAPTLRAMNFDKSHAKAGGQLAVAVSIRGREGGATAELAEDGDISPAIRSSQGGGDKPHVLVGAVAIAENQRGEVIESDIAPSIKGQGGKPGQGYAAALTGAGVRRLTPTECERLQGFPDEYTLAPVRRGKKTKLAEDGPRYAALGNSMPVSLMTWVGERLSRHLDGLEWS
jgi:DNA (cytosine-5)-methyltransferase 1